MITETLIQQFQKRYHHDPVNTAVSGAFQSNGILESSLNHAVRAHHPFVFSEETSRGKITDQKRSGRCWMFSALNTARVDVMSKLNVETFEFSQTYPLFWDKLEKSHFFLTNIIKTVDEPRDSRLIWHLLQKPQEDGGQWEMFAGILQKYGSVPKSVMPETFHSGNTAALNRILNDKLREFAYAIRQAAQKGAKTTDLEAMRDEQMFFIYQLLTNALGEVPQTFEYSYRDKDGEFHRLKAMTPQEFFNQYVDLPVQEMVSIINAPTADKPFGKTYTVAYLGSIDESEPVKYLNAPIEVLKESAIRAIQDGQPVWFGCDVGQQSYNPWGIMDAQLYQFKNTLGEEFHLTKEQRLDYSVSLLTHAMVLVGVDLDDKGNPINWQVENSWGEKVGDKGIFSMSDQWFDEYNFQITVPKHYVAAEWLEKYDQEPIELAPWDPMGSLAVHH